MDAQERTDPAQSREAGCHVRECGARRMESSATVFPHASAARGSGRSVPFFPSASDALGRQGFVRVINHTAVAGKVTIGAFDDEGASYGPLTLSVGTGETVHFDSGDLEDGNGGMGLSGSTGPGEGNWRLELESELDIEILAYIRTADGFLTAMQDTVPVEDGRHRVATFNPGSNASQVSLLRLVNPGDEDVEVSIAGVDDQGTSPADGGATAWIPAGASRVYTAAELESGNAQGLEGSIGNGAGKWRLVVESGQPVVAMSLLSSPTGHMTNLSTVPTHESGGVHRVPLFPPAFDPFGQQGFVRVVNRSDAAGEVRIEAFDDTAWTYDAPVLSIGAGATAQFNSEDLEFGNADRGLVGSTGTGQGNWRLRLTSELDIEVLSYVRTEGDGYSPMHDTATRESEGLKRYYVPLFHGAGHETQESRLLLVNLDTGEARVGIGGLDDAGTPPEGDVSLVLAAGQARMLTAGELEQGGYGLDGRFGRGSERWRLFVAADRPLHVMSLGYGRNGFLANLSRRAPAAELEGRPDVVVAQPSVNDDRPEAGGTFTLSATVRNGGDGEATATTLRYYRSANAAITTADEEVGTDAVGGLAASASSDESVALSAPSDPGDHYYGACVDAVAGESDATNNCSARVRVRVRHPRHPDLVVEAPSVDDTTPDPGAEFKLSATVRNRGDGGAAATTLRYFRSSNATISTGDAEVGTDAVGGLAASGAGDESATLSAPSDPGAYYYGACVDAVAGESDTSNNCSTAVRVTVPQPPRHPDLVVDAPSVDDTTPDPGAEFKLSATVRNRGDGDATATTLRYFRSSNATISTGDAEVGTDAVGGLAASASSDESVALSAPSDPGDHYYGACVDAVADESDTSNNCSSSVRVTVPQPPRHPDLVVDAPSVDDTTPDAGAEFKLSATVRNRGDGDATATTLRYFRSSNATISTGDAEVGTDAVGGLAASASSDESVALSAPSDPGDHYYGACVDAVAGESDTSNNCSSSVRVTVPQPPRHPDLVVDAPSVDDTTPDAGAEFKLSATVRNRGDGDATATTLRYYRSADASISTADMEVGTDAVGGLAASASSDESVALSAPSDPGDHYYGACVDAVAGESDTSNNCSTAVRVTVPQPPRHPDLVVDAPSVDDTTPDAGAEFRLSATVRNRGDGDATATTLRYFRSSNATISTGDAEVGTDAVGGLAASASSDESVALSAPSDPGDHYYGACVDAVADESDTSNNCSSSVRVTVPQPPRHPDLVVDAPSVDDTTPDAGAEFKLSATVRNRGDGDATATTLRYFRSSNATISTGDAEVGTDAVGGLAASGAGDESATLSAPSDPGAYYYGTCVDAVADESDTSNNCSIAVRVTVREPPKLPDLVVDAPAVDDTTPDAGAEFKLSATVRNRGDAAAAATTLRYYRSIDWTISRSDMELGTDAVAGLAPSGSGDESITLTAPSDPGTYYYGACVDAVADESETGNNCSGSVQVTVPEPVRMSDLVVETPTVSESEPHPGAEFKLSATVRNQGDESSGSAWLHFYHSADADIATTDVEVGRALLELGGGVAASASSEGWIWLRAPSDPGTYHYGACVETVTDESDTTNNCSSSVQVTVPEPTTFPDLVVDAPGVSESEPDANGPFTLSATVRNRGDADAGATTLRYYRSADAAITTEDAEVATGAVGKLATSGASDESARLSAPRDPGTYYYGACVDAVAGESDTTNNCSAAVRVTVPQPESGPDLVVDAPPLGDGDAGGGDFTVSATVRNRGGTAAAATVVVYYHSRDAHISTEDSAFIAARAHNVDVPALAPSETSTHSALFQVPWSPGAHYYGACVDAVPGESDTSNNCSAAIVLLQPDLRADSVSARRWLDKGEEFGLYAVVRNRGSAASASTRRRYYHSEDAAISTSDTEVANEWVSRMPPTGLNGWNVRLTAPSDPGIHYYGACIDAVPGESDTTNNCSEGYRVQVFGKPDLVVRDPSVSESNPEPDTEFTLSATVSNQGDADSLYHTTLRYYRSVGTRISTSDVEVGTSWVGPIRVSRSYEWSLTLNAPSTVGTYFYGACVDAVSNESDQTNNCSTAVRVTVVE